MAERASETGPENVKRNYAALLTQGVSGSATNQLTSIGLVLPFLYTLRLPRESDAETT